MEIDKKQVGQRIKRLRLDFGLTLEEFGKKFNTSKATVYNWEVGRNLPNKENTKEIASLGGISINELLYGKLGIKIYDSTYLRVLEPLKLKEKSEIWHRSSIDTEETSYKFYTYKAKVEIRMFDDIILHKEEPTSSVREEIEVNCTTPIEINLHIPFNANEDFYYSFYGAYILEKSPYSSLFEEAAITAMKEYLIFQALVSDELNKSNLTIDIFNELT